MRGGLVLERLEPHQADPAHAILAASGDELARLHGPGRWSETVKPAVFKRGVLTRVLYLACRQGEAVATFCLGQRRPLFYPPALFSRPEAPAVYLSSMAVAPQVQGQGIGRWCLGQAEGLAARQHLTCLRLDAYEGPAGAGPFYEKCGYRALGRVPLSEAALIVYEKEIPLEGTLL
jgi:GNAT superfamily N-acetyltransferase